jgi:quinoprotein dehydrogenase-associated probable ABC transporter substrate-binding protein/PQQ-dependent catabolism-associated CXXCW motif protein
MAGRATASLRRLAAGLLLMAVALAPVASQAAFSMGELSDRNALRVCADPANLPFSNDKAEGFENRIAALMAEKLGVPIRYTWYPQSMGFVRNTLGAHRCDIVMGVPTGDELTQNTNPYYHSTYVLAFRSSDADLFGSLDSPLVRTARIGVVAGTPPSSLLTRRGLSANEVPYHLVVDTRVDRPGQRMIEDLAKGDIDMALAWGPIAGYWAKQQTTPITLVPLASDPRSGLRMDFRISMGIRPDEPEWKLAVNGLIAELQPQITEILLDYGVPLLDERGRLVERPDGGKAPAREAPAAARAVPEPEGYRMEDYKAPVPATLEGATVLDTAGLEALMEESRPVLVDVYPKPPRPEGRSENQLWIEPKRDNIKGSVWLPNVGYGALSPELEAYFRKNLETLTGGDRAKPVVFYCDVDCWMSWNAAKRAIHELGYEKVYWYPLGVEGWQEAGHALVPGFAVSGPTSAR